MKIEFGKRTCIYIECKSSLCSKSSRVSSLIMKVIPHKTPLNRQQQQPSLPTVPICINSLRSNPSPLHLPSRASNEVVARGASVRDLSSTLSTSVEDDTIRTRGA